MRLLVVDDHPAVRAGLIALLRSEPGMVVVGSAERCDQALERSAQGRPEIVLVDYHLPDTDGLQLCRELKRHGSPYVVVYSAFADTELAVPAHLAGADGLVDKSAPTEQLFSCLRRVYNGETVLPTLSPQVKAASAGRLERRDLPIISMLLDGTRKSDIAEVMEISESQLEDRVGAMLDRLRTTLDEPLASLNHSALGARTAGRGASADSA